MLTTKLRKKLKSQVSQMSEVFAIGIAECSVHGEGSRECECGTLAYQYDYLVNALRSTDALPAAKHGKQQSRRRKYRPIHAAPHFAKPGLVQQADESYLKAVDLGHDVEVIWDDSCCAAMYCSECDTWGFTMYDYLDDPEGAVEEGEMYLKECGS